MVKGKKKSPTAKRVHEHVALEKGKDEEFQARIRAKKAKKGQEEEKRGVVLLSHIPHGFYESQMHSFFSQFGEVTRLKLIRSKKTGRSRHFAFIEFQYEEVAKIVAETMDNYLMYQKILKCKLLPLEEVKPLTFANWQNKFSVPKTRAKAIKEHNKPVRDPEQEEKRISELKAKRARLQKKLKDLGIDYDVMNIKMNESFVPPERPRATPEEVAHAMRDIRSRRSQEPLHGEDDDDDEDDDEESGRDIPPKDVDEGTPAGDADADEETTTPSSNEQNNTKAEVKSSPRKKRTVALQKGEKKDAAVNETSPLSSGAQNVTDRELKARRTPRKKSKAVMEEENSDKNVAGQEGDFGVMVVDLDDSDITFKSPPADARIRRKSIGPLRKAGKRSSDEANSKDSDDCENEKKKPRRKKAASKVLADCDDTPQVVKKVRKKVVATPGCRVKGSESGEASRPSTRRTRSKVNKTM